MDADSEQQDVVLHMYDLTNGMARTIVPALLGVEVEGIWHTGVVIFGNEYFYGGGGGVCVTRAGRTPYGEPTKKMSLGQSAVPISVFQDFLSDLSTNRFQPTSYHLLQNNCNHFSNEVANFLCGVDIPEEILNLPEQLLNTPFGASLRPMLETVNVASPEFAAFSINNSPSAPSSGEAKGPASAPKSGSTTHASGSSSRPTGSGAPSRKPPGAPVKEKSKPDPSTSPVVQAVRELVAQEFESLMSTGQYTADAAAAEAIRRVRNRAA